MNANAPHDANAVALDVDHNIDRALSALRDAQPRSGSEMFASRILASLEHRTAAPQSARFHISAHLALWTATAATILAIASLVILHQHTASTANQASVFVQHSTNPAIPSDQSNAVILSERSESKDPANTSRANNNKPFSASNLTRTTHSVLSRPERVARSGETCISDHLGCPIREGTAPTTTPTDAQLLADLHAPSHPAPPLPLTPQEKLFLRMLRYGNATQVAELNPIVRAQHDADETAAFKAFFPDPPPLQQPNGDTE